MKNMKLTQISLLIISAVSLVSCSSPRTGTVTSINKAVPGTSRNPLNPAGTSSKPKEKVAPAVTFKPGTFLATQSADVAMFTRSPSRSDQPVRTLVANEDVKVISSKASYTKIEVVRTGQVGFVPTVTLGKKRYANKVVKKKPTKAKPTKATTKYKPVAKKSTTVTPSSVTSVPERVVIPDIAEVTPLPAPAPLPTPAAVVESVVPTPSSFSVVEDLPLVAPSPVSSGISLPEVINPLLPAE